MNKQEGDLQELGYELTEAEETSKDTISLSKGLLFGLILGLLINIISSFLYDSIPSKN